MKGKYLMVILIIIAGTLAYLSWQGLKWSDTAEFCGTLCHGMDTPYETWYHSSHRPFTNCNTCHLPPGAARAYWKPRYGIRDFYVYFIGDTPDLYRTKPPTPVITRDNCLDCHGDIFVEPTGTQGLNCLSCHRHVPHRH